MPEQQPQLMPLGIVLYGRNYVNIFPSRFPYFSMAPALGALISRMIL